MAFLSLHQDIQLCITSSSIKLRQSGDCDLETEAQHALGQKTSPHELLSATVELNEALIKVKNATNNGRLTAISMAGHLLRRAVETLVRLIPGVCESALGNPSVRRGDIGNTDLQQTDIDDEEEQEDRRYSINEACKHVISGACSSLSELVQLMHHLIESVDSGPSSPASTQVTLATRRLRETVHEIVEGAKIMCGTVDQINTAVRSIAPPTAPKPNIRPRTNGPSVSPKPFSVVINFPTSPSTPGIPPVPRTRLQRKASLMTSQVRQDQVEESIAAANATAADAVSVPLQNELTAMAGELEQHVYQIGQLHSRRARIRAEARRSLVSTREMDHNSLAEPNPPPISPTYEAAEGSLDSLIVSSQHVVHTTLSLMYWAAAAQRELVQQGRMKPVQAEASESESQWDQGLISAARYVAAAANCVVDSAKAIVAVRCSSFFEHDEESGLRSLPSRSEQLISAAHTTASCTAQLVLACMAKADPTSPGCVGLRRAGMEVRGATEQLIRLTKSYKNTASEVPLDEMNASASFDGLNLGVVSSMRQVIETKSSIAAKQRELESLHSQLKHINRDQYKSHEV